MSAALTPNQKDAVRGLLKGLENNPYQTLGGYAGTGKTVCVGVLTDVDKLSNFKVCAYTGKAANVLRRRGVSNASTIHSLIYKPITEDGELIFRKCYPSEVDADGFIVDEASMVGGEIHKDLLSFGKPIIYVGDHGQLEPINSDFNLMAEPMYRLEEVHRNAGPIAHFAEHLRKGLQAGDFDGGGEKVYLASSRDITDEHLTATDQVIAAYNRFRVDMNDRIRRNKHQDKKSELTGKTLEEYHQNCDLLGESKAQEILMRDHGKYADGWPVVMEGDRVMCLRNNKKLCLFNGMQAVVSKVHRWNFFDIKTDDGKDFIKIKYLPEQFGKEKNESKYVSDGPVPFDYAWCVTCHKAQGDEWQNVIVYEQMCDKWDHKRWAYTAASRAKNSLIWILGRPKASSVYVPEWLKESA